MFCDKIVKNSLDNALVFSILSPKFMHKKVWFLNSFKLNVIAGLLIILFKCTEKSGPNGRQFKYPIIKKKSSIALAQLSFTLHYSRIFYQH